MALQTGSETVAFLAERRAASGAITPWMMVGQEDTEAKAIQRAREDVKRNPYAYAPDDPAYRITRHVVIESHVYLTPEDLKEE